MKNFLVLFSCLLLAVGVIFVLPAAGEEALYHDVIRLHVLAPSDREEDQQLKLLVRDEILAVYSDRLKEAGNIEDAALLTEGLLTEIRKTAEGVVKREGYSYPVSVSFGEERYPTRSYGAYDFPAGTYRSLKIVIGEGAGQNWWCVLFPPLCLNLSVTAPADDSLAVGLTPEEYALISGGEGGYRVKFKTLEVLEELFGGS